MSGLFQELKRRNVFRVGVAYVVAAWLILQFTDLVLDNINAPDWVMQAIMLVLAIGLPVTLILAWAFEMTPDGLKREKEVDRSQSITSQTGRRLNRITIVALALAVATLLTDKFLLQPDAADQSSARAADKSVAVLPFVAMSNGPDDEYFADGLTEEILNSLTQLPELLVTARTSAFYFKGQNIPVQQIAEALNVAHVVEGSVRRDGERLRITAQLIRAKDSFHLWSNTYDRTSADSFSVQTDIAEKIASSLDVVLNNESRARMSAAGLRNPEAFVAYQKGFELHSSAHGSEEMLTTLRAANAYFERAIDLVPDFSNAYLHHADYYTHLLGDLALNEHPAPELLAQADSAVIAMEADFDAAVRFAPNDEQRTNAAIDRALVTGRWRGLSDLIDTTVAQPGCATSGWLTMAAYPFGRIEDVSAGFQRRIDCDPLDFSAWKEWAYGALWLGNFDGAADIARNGLQKTAHEQLTKVLAFALIAKRQFDEAEAVIERDIHYKDNVLAYRLMLAAARADKESAEELLGQVLLNLGSAGSSIVSFPAVVGDRDRANQLAADIDARPYGYMILMESTFYCLCGAPFDITVAPNFARMLNEAELSWPPASPIDWPLKQW